MRRARKVLFLMFAALVAQSGCSRCVPGKEARLTKDSDNPECRKELAGALEALRKGLGMGTQMTNQDVEAVLRQGKVVKSYVRDGVTYKMHIMVRKKGGKCLLLVGKKEREEPGHTSVKWGNYGSVTLNVCKCQ